MRVLSLLLFMLSFVFGLSINDVNVKKNSIVFNVSDIDYSQVGALFDASYMKCDPKLDGVFHLENGANLVFYSKKNLPTSTTFNCEINGDKVSFKSDEFKVVNFENVKNDSFFIAFNDDVKNLQKHIRLSDEKLKFSISNIDKSSFIIDVENPNKSKYDLFITSNLQSQSGATLKNELKLSQINDIKSENLNTLTIDTNRIKAISYPNKMLGFRLYFNVYLNINNLFIQTNESLNFTIQESGYIYEDDDRAYFYADIVSKDLKPNKEYEITLLKGFGDVYGDWGSILKDDVKFSFKTTDYKKEVKFSDQKPYISNKGGVFINSVNVNEIKTMLSRVDDENLRYFLNFSEGNESFSEFKNQNFTLDSVPNEDINSTVKFDDIKDGIYKFDVFYKDGKKLENISKYLYFGDIAVHAKVFNDSVFVFLNRLSSNEVVSGANITLFSDKNKVLATGKSAIDGTFNFNEKDLLKKRPKSILIEFGDERNFLIFNEKNGEFENLYQKTFSKPKAYVYLASDIIRPNKELKGTVIVKENFKSLKNLPVNLQIYNPKNSKIYDESLNLDEFGTIDLNIKESFELSGKYKINVIFEDKIITTKEFSVESFVPQSLKASAKFSKNVYKNSDILKLNLNASYLFGQNATNSAANLNVIINNSSFENEKFKAYVFDERSDNSAPIYNYNYPILLDENGSLEFVINPSFKTKLNSKLEINTNFMVNDGGKSSSDYTTSVIYPYESIVGVAKEDLSFKFASIDPVTLQDTNSTLKAKLYFESWNYNFNEKGYISWFATHRLIDEFDIKFNSLNLSNLNDGSYKLTVKDLNSTHESSISFGVGNFLNPTDNLNLANITLDKQSYKQGDTIKANISSPLKNALLLVTLEDDKVLDHQIVQVSNYSATVEFEINDEFNGMYLSAKALRVADLPSYLLPFKAGNFIYIAKDSSDKKLELELNLPNQTASNKDIEVSVKTAPNSKVYLFAVDYGVLNIVNQKSPEASQFFSAIKEKGFFNFDIYNELTHFKTGGKTLSFGSGGEAMLMSLKKYMDPLEDKDNYIKMFQSISDENGTAKFSLNIPINTKARVDVIALNDEKINEVTKDIVIKDDILVKMPKISYLLQGDSITLPIRVFNNTDENKTINLDINSTLELSKFENSLNLDPNSFKTLNLEVKAKQVGKASIKVLDKTLKFEILPSGALNTKVINGVVEGNKTINLNDSYKSAKLSISNSPKALFFKDFGMDIFYNSTQELCSRLMMLLEDEETTNSLIKSLESKQKSDGNFGYWDGDSLTHDFITAYATDTLLTLKEKGYKVSDLVIKKALNALSNKGMSDRLADIYALYLLTQNGMIDESKINIFYDKKYYKNNIASLYMMAAILQKAGLNSELETVKNEIKEYRTSKLDYESLSSEIRDLSFALYLDLKHFSDENEDLLEKVISLKDTISSNHDKVFVLRALSQLKTSDEKVSVRVENGENIYILNGDITLDLNLTSSNLNLHATKGRPYFSLIGYGYEELSLKHELGAKPLNVYREFIDMNGNVVNLNDIRLNDIIFAKVTLNSKVYYEDVLAYQKAPSCFEVINERVVQNIRSASQADSINFTHIDVSDTGITNFLEPFYGEVSFYVPFRAVLKGSCMLPEIRVERMHDEKVNDYDLEVRTIEVK